MPTVRKWWCLAAVSLAGFLGSVMSLSIEMAFPVLLTTFRQPFAVVQWVILAFLCANVALLPVVGRVADVVAQKRLFTRAYAVFIVATLACGLSPSVGVLVAARAVQGVAFAVLAVLGLAIIARVFGAHERGAALGVDAALLSAGVILGPTLGGVVTDYLSWRWIFLGVVPLAGLGLYLGWRYLPDTPGQRGARFDLLGGLLLSFALLTFLLSLTSGQLEGFIHPVTGALFAAAITLSVVFVQTQRAASTPLLDLSLLRNRDLSWGIVSGLVVYSAISGVVFLMPFYLQQVLGQSPNQAGLLLSVPPALLVLGSLAAGRLTDRAGPYPLLLTSLGFLLVGYFAVGFLDAETTARGFLLAFLPLGVGMGLFATPNSALVMNAVPESAAGMASGLLNLSRSLGSTLGVAALGALWSARVARASREAGVTEQAAQVAGLQSVSLLVCALVALTLLATGVVWRTRCRADRAG